MPQRLPAFPELPAFPATVTLDEAEYVVTFIWRDRLGCWTMDIADTEGNNIARGRRVTTGWGPLTSIVSDDLPNSLLVVVGPNVYEQADLGGQVAVIEWTQAEVDAIPTATPADAPVVTV